MTIKLLIIIILIFSNHAFASIGGGSTMPSASAPQIDPVVKYQEGVEFLIEKKYKKAIKSFRSVLKVARTNAAAHYLLGLSYMGLEKYKKARKPLSKAIKYQPELIEAYGQLGFVYNKLGKQDDANKQLEILNKFKSECNQCADEKKIDQSIQFITSDDKDDSLSSNIQLLTPMINAQAADDNYLEAVGLINKGDYSKALESLQKLAMIFGPHPDILTYQGFAHRNLGRIDKAFFYYQMALNIDPNHLGANEYLGEYYVQIGQMKLAKNQLVILDKLCNFGCEEVEELNRWILKGSS